VQKHAPEMKEIQKKYKGDRQKLNEELMKFYKENHINPGLMPATPRSAAGVLRAQPDAEALSNHAKSARPLWLHIVPSITEQGRFALVGLPAARDLRRQPVLSSYFMSTTMDKTQRLLMMVAADRHHGRRALPTGLVLYWVTTNLWTVRAGLITRGSCRKTPLRLRVEADVADSRQVEPEPVKLAAAPSRQAPPRGFKRKKGGGRPMTVSN